jgi:catechol 2,3-dioxygenase
MKAHYLGHVVFYVKNLERSLAFYRDLLGFKEVGRIFDGKAAALTSGRTHHEFLFIEVGDAPGPDIEEGGPVRSASGGYSDAPAPRARAGEASPSLGHRIGLYHIGIKIGDSLDELRAALKELQKAGVTITGASDHTVSKSLYLIDPDGNEVELYVDADPSIWKKDPAAVLSPIKPLRL